MSAPFPHHYSVTLEGLEDGSGVLASRPRPDIAGGAPREFGGLDRWWSPEHLLLGSLSLCLMTTFRAFAAREKLAVLGFECRTEGVLDRTPAGLAFTSLGLRVDLRVPPADLGRAERLLHSAKKHCIVANSLNAAVGLEVSVIAAEPQPEPAP
jgi:organic hydroperoxide reductase OsmC/OhrA